MNSPEFELFGWNTPNGQKIIIALEEVGVQYSYTPIDISKGQQHDSSFRAISPDGKIPALIHRSSETVTVFESGAILMYLANLYPALTGESESTRASVMAWTFWQVGQLGPLAGQFGRFQIANPPNPDAVEHFKALVWRCLDVMENQLSKSTFLASEQFSVADIASYPWIASQQSYLQRYNLQWREKYPALVRWADSIAVKPSAIKALGLG